MNCCKKSKHNKDKKTKKVFKDTVSNILHSPYAGQEVRDIKALSLDDVKKLLAGSGTPFGGMAKSAELNNYPGPLHVLDAYEAGEFELIGQQLEQVKAAYDEMHSVAINLGKQLINVEREIDSAFANKKITKELLRDKVSESAKLYGQLRIAHLRAHLSMVNILTPQQIDLYDKLRGYK